ncbi:MAG: hypothetical protein EA408_03025 [Marinilabiliales bacterium]|nr:MAG: hypothetical protein EA408_03025 [Marinilabiliales bacterium]
MGKAPGRTLARALKVNKTPKNTSLMLLRLLKYNTTIGYLLIPLLAVAAWLPSMMSPGYDRMVFDNAPMPLYGLLADYLPHSSLASKIVALVLLTASGFYLIRINNKYMLLQERTLLPAFLFVTIICSMAPLHRLHPALISMIFFVPAIEKLLDSYKAERLSYNYFEASFLIGLGSLFYFNLIWYIIIVWVALLILRPVIWREWVFSVIGAATPWFFLVAGDLLLNESAEYTWALVTANFNMRDVYDFAHLPEMIYFGFLLLVVLFASRKMARSMGVMKVIIRKIFLIFFWVYAVGAAAYFLVETANIEMVVPATLPVAFLLSHYLLSFRKTFWPNLILWFTVAGMVVLVWGPW